MEYILACLQPFVKLSPRVFRHRQLFVADVASGHCELGLEKPPECSSLLLQLILDIVDQNLHPVAATCHLIIMECLYNPGMNIAA